MSDNVKVALLCLCGTITNIIALVVCLTIVIVCYNIPIEPNVIVGIIFICFIVRFAFGKDFVSIKIDSRK